MTHKVIEATPGGRVVLILEGGYDIPALTTSVEACMKVSLTSVRQC